MCGGSENELIVRPRHARQARIVVPATVGLLLAGIVVNPADTEYVVAATALLLGGWAIGIRARYLFVQEDRAGIRYVGRIERSVHRRSLLRVIGEAGRQLAFMGERRRPLLVINTAAWTEEQVARFLQRLDVPVEWR